MYGRAIYIILTQESKTALYMWHDFIMLCNHVVCIEFVVNLHLYFVSECLCRHLIRNF